MRPRTLAAVAVALLLSGGSYAFTASNTVAATAAGTGSAAISGYTVTGVSYTMSTDPGSYSQASASNPMIASITFTLAEQSGTAATPSNTEIVDAVITSTASGVSPVNYSSCSAPSTTSDVWTCSLVGTQAMSVQDASSLTVTASDNSSSVASAAGLGTEYYVSNSGKDSASCGLSPSSACATIQQAVDNASSGDTINVEDGTYTNNSTTNSSSDACLGSSTPLVIVGKPLTFIGNGSTITGAGSSFCLLNTASGSSGVTGVTIEGFNFSKITGSGYNGVITVPGYGAGNVIIKDNTFNTTTDEAIGYHGNDGLTAPLGTGFSIVDNTVTDVTGNNGTLRSGMWLGNLSDSVIAGNTINTTAYSGLILNGFVQGDEQNNAVFDNTVKNVPETGIQIAYGINDQVVGNTVSNAGNGTSTLNGKLNPAYVSGRNCAICLFNTGQTSITVKSNTLTGSWQGIGVGETTASGIGALGSGIVIGFNDITNDPPSSNTAGGGAGIQDNATSGTLNATDNWWGCNGGPGATGCTTVIDSSGSTVDYTPWLTLTASASPTSITTSDSATITASLTENSAGSNTSGEGVVPDGIPVGFFTNLGSVSPPSATTSDGTATSTLKSSSTGTATVTVTVDNASVTVTVTVT